MFDVGFWELAVIFVIGLLVLGPERLPQVATQIGQWVGRARRMARMLNTQLQDEMRAIDPGRVVDPYAAPPKSPAGDWSRPGVDDLKPGNAAADTSTGSTETARSPESPGDTRP